MTEKIIWKIIALIGMLIIIGIMIYIALYISHLPKDPCALCEEMYNRTCMSLLGVRW